MEVVVGVIFLSKASIFALDALLKRKQGAQDLLAEPLERPSSRTTPETQSKIQELEERLNRLNEEARAANSPDTFVQYARLKRSANAVEKELASLKEAEQPTLPMLELLSSMLPTQNVSRTIRTRLMQMLLGVLPLFFLWGYFRFWSEQVGHAVIVADCDVFRPFSSFFSTDQGNCNGLDTCAVQNKCTVEVLRR